MTFSLYLAGCLVTPQHTCEWPAWWYSESRCEKDSLMGSWRLEYVNNVYMDACYKNEPRKDTLTFFSNGVVKGRDLNGGALQGTYEVHGEGSSSPCGRNIEMAFAYTAITNLKDMHSFRIDGEWLVLETLVSSGGPEYWLYRRINGDRAAVP